MSDVAGIRVMLSRKVHLVVGGMSLCGKVEEDEADCYPDSAGLRAWNGGPLDRCEQCARALLTRTRPRADVIA